MNWFVYILQCADNSYYVGITNHLQKRIRKHNSKKGSKYLFGKLPVKLEYCESWPDKSEARKREIQKKGWTRAKKEKLMKGLFNKPNYDDS